MRVATGGFTFFPATKTRSGVKFAGAEKGVSSKNQDDSFEKRSTGAEQHGLMTLFKVETHEQAQKLEQFRKAYLEHQEDPANTDKFKELLKASFRVRQLLKIPQDTQIQIDDQGTMATLL